MPNRISKVSIQPLLTASFVASTASLKLFASCAALKAFTVTSSYLSARASMACDASIPGFASTIFFTASLNSANLPKAVSITSLSAHFFDSVELNVPTVTSPSLILPSATPVSMICFFSSAVATPASSTDFQSIRLR